jgi:hypothetical protein
MHRQPPLIRTELEGLLDERDHLQIQINLAVNAPKADPDKLEALIGQLAQLELEISDHWRRPRP